MSTTRPRAGRQVLGLGALACAGCCAGPLLAFLGGLGITGLASTTIIGVAGLVVAAVALTAYIVVRRRHHVGAQRRCTDPRRQQMRIPVDETAPIACTASSEEIPLHIEWVEQMRTAHRAIERTEEGIVLHFAPEATTEALLQRFAVAEKGCCEFWGFEIDHTPQELTFHWDGPPGIAEYMDRLHAWFGSDEPLTAQSGLL